MHLRHLIVAATVLLTATAAAAQPRATLDADAIRHVMKATWDKPGDGVDVGPIVIVADVAIAGWTQGDMGGRALLRNKAGVWTVVLCAGDQLKQTEALHMAGIADDTARQLTAALADSESKIAPARVATFARFEGLVTMDNHGGHTGHRH